jgi:hypothetical protein
VVRNERRRGCSRSTTRSGRSREPLPSRPHDRDRSDGDRGRARSGRWNACECYARRDVGRHNRLRRPPVSPGLLRIEESQQGRIVGVERVIAQVQAKAEEVGQILERGGDCTGELVAGEAQTRRGWYGCCSGSAGSPPSARRYRRRRTRCTPCRRRRCSWCGSSN